MKRCAWVMLALLIAAPAGASMFLGLTRGQLVAQSSAVIEGEVLKINSFWEPTGRIIVTEAMVRVTDLVAGEAPTVVVLRTMGGEAGGYKVVADGFPTFRVGERLLLFLQEQPDGTAEVTGYRQGQFRILLDKAGVARAVPTLEAGVQLVLSDGRPAPRPVALDLATFKSEIRDAAARAAIHRTTAE